MVFETLIITFLMVVAIMLILLEIFLLPGITVALAGGVLFAAGGLFYAYSISQLMGHLTFGLSLLTFTFLFFWLLRTKSFNRVALHTEINSKLVSNQELGIQVGDKGISCSRLSPIGKARIRGIVIEVKSIDELIDENSPIEVILVDRSQVIVKSIETINHNLN